MYGKYGGRHATTRLSPEPEHFESSENEDPFELEEYHELQLRKPIKHAPSQNFVAEHPSRDDSNAARISGSGG